MESMGQRIRRLRLQRGLSQEELGAKMGLKKAAINKYESNHVENMKRSVIAKMSILFDVSPGYLMALEDVSIPLSATVDDIEPPKKSLTIEETIEVMNQLGLDRQENVLQFAKAQFKAYKKNKFDEDALWALAKQRAKAYGEDSKEVFKEMKQTIEEAQSK